MDPLASNTMTMSSNGSANTTTESHMHSAASANGTPAIPDATEVNPSLYDEIKLGQKGSGFKRLVS